MLLYHMNGVLPGRKPGRQVFSWRDSFCLYLMFFFLHLWNFRHDFDVTLWHFYINFDVLFTLKFTSVWCHFKADVVKATKVITLRMGFIVTSVSSNARQRSHNGWEVPIENWSTSWQNKQNGMCTQWRLRSACASAQSGLIRVFAVRSLGS